MQITNVKCPEDKYSIKCPYEMIPEYITVHNTYNDASAMSLFYSWASTASATELFTSVALRV